MFKSNIKLNPQYKIYKNIKPSRPRALVRASSSVLPLAYQKAHPLATIVLSPLQPTPTHENAVLLKKVLYLNTTIKCVKSH